MTLPTARLRLPLIAWVVAVAIVYTLGIVAVASGFGRRVEPAAAAPPSVSTPAGVSAPAAQAVPPTVALQIAQNLLRGDPRLDAPPGLTDTVTRGGHSYLALSIGPILPFVVFAPLPAAWPVARWVITLLFGVGAALSCWPLASRYGPGGSSTVWLATLGAVGTVLLPLSVMGNEYYLAHQEAMLATNLGLIELRGRRRPWVIGLALGAAALARPTVILAVVPIGAFALAEGRPRLRSVVGFAVPIAAVLAVIGWYNLARFGSPFDSGYATSILYSPPLILAREQGLFSFVHVVPNLEVLVGGGVGLSGVWPYVVPSSWGQSILLTTPAVLLAVRAGVRDRLAITLWSAAAVVVAALLCYYGGAGFETYGDRYLLDAMPFVLALVALGAARHFDWLAKTLIVASIAFCAYGVVWGAYNGHF